MAIELYEHQLSAIEKLKPGSILCGGVGSGKSRTALAYYFQKIGGGAMKINGIGKYGPMVNPLPLYIITTARKRDTLEWEEEGAPFLIAPAKRDPKKAYPLCTYLLEGSATMIVDSWNNIEKYKDVKDAFFIFDEQRVVGAGAWVKSFLKIASRNLWILLSATPGDTWMDYIPVFVANGFYKNRTEFIRRHVVYGNFSKFPKVDHYIEVSRLIRLRDQVIVDMRFTRNTIANDQLIITDYDKELTKRLMVDRWNPFEARPVKDISELCYLMRKVANSSPDRVKAVDALCDVHHKVIIFYNFNYELALIRELADSRSLPFAEWNGHKHEPIPKTSEWLYAVQYFAGAEAWNCIETNVIIFYSQSYSYKTMIQAAGRIDRLNTPFIDLYYYHLRSASPIDLAIRKALDSKRNFNESRYFEN